MLFPPIRVTCEMCFLLQNGCSTDQTKFPFYHYGHVIFSYWLILLKWFFDRIDLIGEALTCWKSDTTQNCNVLKRNKTQFKCSEMHASTQLIWNENRPPQLNLERVRICLANHFNLSILFMPPITWNGIQFIFRYDVSN